MRCAGAVRQPSDDRVNYRNGYRDRWWDTRAGTIKLAIPRPRRKVAFPGVAAGAAPPV